MPNARDLAIKIWQSGVHAVRAEQLIADRVHCDADRLTLCDTSIELSSVGQIGVVGAGKAAGYLARELVAALRPIANEKRLHGLINVPEDCVLPLDYLRLHAARPAGVNEPRPEGVEGTRRILEMVSKLQPQDLCICLITGGGSALLPAPLPPVTLEDKRTVTKLMGARGASIGELNVVRIALSAVKGGGLLRQCKANRLVTLVVSDILGDPLELIASGPTIPGKPFTVSPDQLLRQYVAESEVSSRVWSTLAKFHPRDSSDIVARSECHLLANNQTAVDAARTTAERLGLQTLVLPAESPKTTAEQVADELIARLGGTIDQPTCIIWGGEPVVQLCDEPGRGGRNQQLVLAALCRWSSIAASNHERVCILSGGTDGEDGPTDAAGAFVDAEVVRAAEDRVMSAGDFLARNDAYSFFEPLGGLLKTGPTHTNVCDLRVVVVA